MKKGFWLLVLMCLGSFAAQGQLISISPPFPTVEDTITVVFDATEGNGGLEGISPVYIHNGLITSLSSGPSDWKYVPTQWGVDDPTALMTDLGDNKHSLTYHIRSFHGFPMGTEVAEQLSFVFRDMSGNTTGKDPDGNDIYYPVWDGQSFEGRLFYPEQVTVLDLGESIDIRGGSTDSARINIVVNGSIVATDSLKELAYTFDAMSEGNYEVTFQAILGSDTLRDTRSIIVRGMVVAENPPASIIEGINYVDDTTVILALFAPEKEFAYVLGEFNDWLPNADYYMKRNIGNTLFWLEISGVNPGQEYAYYYWVDGELRIADPYAEKVLDGWNDPFISSQTYPNLKPYPQEIGPGYVSVFQTNKPAYQWQTTDYQRPSNEDLIIYEMLVRDFVDAHDYQTVIDSLDYLQDMGVNAIELMPVMEFEGNISWGYNPSFFFAPDKYYGTEYDLRAFIDSCHSRGIAVILDMVLNHAFGQCPLVQLYWDGSKPTANSPWFNPDATHPFNVGFDFNHESVQTERFVDRVLRYWVEEYRFDGYRMDLSKGFTQVNNPDDVGAWSAYDASRIAILKRMYDQLTDVDPEVYFILEHFGDNSEEKELAEYGMMTWASGHFNYNEAAMGYHDNGKSNFSWISHQNKGWSVPHAVGFMESHDEERLMYKNLQFGNGSGDYNIKDTEVGLARMEMAGAFFFTIPGPKMVWQFGELGYEVPIDFNGRTGPKPIRWEYLQDYRRKRLYDVWGAIVRLRQENPEVFRTDTYTLEVGNAFKRINLSHTDMNVTIIGNFDVVPLGGDPAFQHTGIWYDYFSDDSIDVTNVNAQLVLDPGEFHIYTDVRQSNPDLNVSLEQALWDADLSLYPNPSQGELTLEYALDRAGKVSVSLMDLQGRVVARPLVEASRSAGMLREQFDLDLSAGLYLLELRQGTRRTIQRVIIR